MGVRVPVLALVQRGPRLPARHGEPVAEHLPPAAAADRPARPEPDRGDHRAADPRRRSSSTIDPRREPGPHHARGRRVSPWPSSSLDQLDEGARAVRPRARGAARADPGRSTSSTSATRASRSASSPAAARCWSSGTALALLALVLFFATPHRPPARLAPDGAAARRRAREPDRPRARGIGDRLREVPALPGVQRRRHRRSRSA